ncbi:MAG: CPBP family intramembrane metalloprotease [Acidobacteria bacterium]|nr:CPBP family intramembrane metalloprotease [Acidobacteriota bacterium]
MRSGWGALLVWVLFFIIARFSMGIFLSTGAHNWAPTGPHLHRPIEYAPEFIALFALFAATYIVSILEHRTLATYGYQSKRKLPLFLLGIGTGLVLVSALIGYMALTGTLIFAGRGLSRLAIFKYACIHAVGFFAIACFEESALRGYLQYTLTRGMTFLYRRIFNVQYPLHWAFWTAAVLLSGVFVLMHRQNYGQSSLGLLAAGLFAMLAAWSLWRTGSLWWAIGFHFACDFSQAFLYGTPVSGYQIRDRLFITHFHGVPFWTGGTAGLQSSVLFLILIAIAAIAVLWLPQEEIYPDIQARRHAPQIPMSPDPDTIRPRVR